VLGLAAAVTFGVSAPLAKVLLDHVDPVMLAGLLYAGAFAALAVVGRPDRSEARVRRTDAPRITLLVVTGGVVAPVLLLLGLERVSGTSGSLLLNLEVRSPSPSGSRCSTSTSPGEASSARRWSSPAR
jgi:drug/metabolite transporter (DMT)-like permease